LARERPVRGGAMRLAAQPSLRGAAALARHVASMDVARRGFAARALALAGQRYAGAPGFRQADGDGLLGRARAVLALADVVDLLAHELAGGGRGSLARAHLGLCPFDGRLLRHVAILSMTTVCTLRARGYTPLGPRDVATT